MKTLISIFSIFVLISSAAALSCYVCNSESDSACGDELRTDSPALQDAFVRECVQNETHTPFCRKVKEYISPVKEESQIRVHRECAYLRREEYDCYQKRSEDYVLDVCQCDKDNCNSAHSITPFSPLFVIPLYFLAKFM